MDHEHQDGEPAMPDDLDRAYIINGHDLLVGLQRADVARADSLAAYLLKFAGKPLDERRWPMARGEMITRLSLALKDKNILIDREQVPGGERHYVQARNPGGLAHELVYAIDEQGDAKPDDVVHAVIHTDGCLSMACGGECSDEYVERLDADDAAVRDLKARLRGLHYETAKRVLAYVSAWHAEGPEPPF